MQLTEPPVQSFERNFVRSPPHVTAVTDRGRARSRLGSMSIYNTYQDELLLRKLRSKHDVAKDGVPSSSAPCRVTAGYDCLSNLILE